MEKYASSWERRAGHLKYADKGNDIFILTYNVVIQQVVSVSCQTLQIERREDLI